MKNRLLYFILACAFFSTGFFKFKAVTPHDFFLSADQDVEKRPAYQRVVEHLDNESARERAKIDFLLDAVKRSRLHFLRNDVDYSGPKAQAHLVWKYHRKIHNVISAKKFIEEVATRSSISGELYLVKIDKDLSYPLRDVLTNELDRLELLLKNETKSPISN